MDNFFTPTAKIPKQNISSSFLFSGNSSFHTNSSKGKEHQSGWDFVFTENPTSAIANRAVQPQPTCGVQGCQQEKLLIFWYYFSFHAWIGTSLWEERNGSVQKINRCSVYAPLGLIHNPEHMENNSGWNLQYLFYYKAIGSSAGKALDIDITGLGKATIGVGEWRGDVTFTAQLKWNEQSSWVSLNLS